MTLDPRQSLQLAFNHLDAFSVPGVGTFRRTRFSAVIDHQAGRIQPPGERFVLEKGEGLVDRLEDFYFRFLDLSIGAAKEVVQAVSGFVQAEVQQRGTVKLPGVGELQRSGAAGLVLMPEAGGSASHHFFGLQPVAFNLNQVGGSQEQEKKAAVKRHVALQGAPVEPPPKPVRDKKRRSILQPIAITLLLLVMLLSGAGIIWQDQFQQWMTDMGWLADSSRTISSDTLQAPKESSALVVLPPDTQAAALANHAEPKKDPRKPKKQDLEPKLVDPVHPVDVVKPAHKKPKPAAPVEPLSADLSDWDGLGEHAKSSVYYLVVGARKDAQEARRIADKITANSGVKARVLVPRVEGPHYKVFVYQDRSKDKVIAKMVEWKTKFPEKSWIFWMGM